jgi:hypothetical protein
MRKEDFRAGVVAGWTGEFIDGILHAKRIQSLSDAVLGALNASSLAVSCIGHAMAEAHGLNTRHATKQIDRLLSNPGIDLAKLFTPWVRKAVGDRLKIDVAMDWTDFDADDQSTIVLSLITGQGRALPLIWLTVYKAELAGRRDEFEDTCLSKLREALPEGVHATIVADRGFADVRLMALLSDMGMDYVIRFRADTFVSAADGETKKAAEWVGAGGRARKLVGASLTRNLFKVGAGVFVKAKGMKDSWCLATSHGTLSARQVIDLYASRWSIETNFRDTKDIRFGMGLAQLRISDPMRRDRLLFISAMATMLITLLGQAGEMIGMDKTLRTSTTKRRTHSLFRQGLMLFGLIPNMPEHRLKPLIGKFEELITQDSLLVAAFAYAEK